VGAAVSASRLDGTSSEAGAGVAEGAPDAALGADGDDAELDACGLVRLDPFARGSPLRFVARPLAEDDGGGVVATGGAG
jgi:hypothetical protein